MAKQLNNNQSTSNQSKIESLFQDLFSEEIDTVLNISQIEDLLNPEIYISKRLPVHIHEFAESPEYLNLKGQLYREVLNILADIEDPDIREADLILGKGSGKSLLATIFSTYGCYTLLEMINPQKVFRLTQNTSLYSINVSINRVQAKNNIFSGIEYLLKHSKYFNRRAVIRTDQIDFDKNICLLCGHSNFSAFLGYPTFRAIIDEANFMVDSQNRSVVQQLYTALRGSLKTRFPRHYKLLTISSDSLPNSFMRQRVNYLKEEIRKARLANEISDDIAHELDKQVNKHYNI